MSEIVSPDQVPAFRLNNGVMMPAVGLGVSPTLMNRRRFSRLRRSPSARDWVRQALEVGYRLIDTARVYRNEADVGLALAQSGVPRSDVFITTKLWTVDLGYKQVLSAFERSLEQLKTDHLDLYLIHWPDSSKRHESWRALEELARDGRCRAIGVSNFTIRHLQELLASSDTVPAVNQVEFSPYLYQRELLEFCRERGIQVQAHSPLTRGVRLQDPRLTAHAQKHGKTTAQLLVRWLFQHEVAAIPHSRRRTRMAQNLDIFDFALSPDEMAALDALHEDLRVTRDPSDVP